MPSDTTTPSNTSPGTPNTPDTPATLLTPTALTLGTLATAGTVPALMLVLFPWSALAGAFALTAGAAAVHYARQGIGRMWPAVTGTALGAVGFIGSVSWLWALGA
ncbi:hypothetical protein AB0O07_17140 [Streptomyces sp. NPDC093085]|uniref:hypothetical protein n=1 Tax=Streptomyces sp. NPDC093085 TaxID=3155068 RepID=UPI0034277EA5